MKQFSILMAIYFFVGNLLFSNTFLFAETLHVVLITDTNSDISTSVKVDGTNMEKYFSTRMPNAKLTWLKKNHVSERMIFHTLKRLPIRNGDSIFCYYSGHGAYDPTKGWNRESHYVQLANNDVIFRHRLLSAIRDRRPRPKMAVLITDCCNAKGTPQKQIPKKVRGILPRASFLEHLFFDHSGWIDLTSSRENQLSYCEVELIPKALNVEQNSTVERGGFFTNALLSVFEDYEFQLQGNPNIKLPGWDQIFYDVRKKTAIRFERRKPLGEKRSLSNGNIVHQRTQTPYLFSKYGPDLQSQRDINGIRFGAQTTNNGQTVLRVFPNTPASLAGLSRADEIVKINGMPIRSYEDFSTAIDFSPQKMKLVFQRSGLLFEKQISLPY